MTQDTEGKKETWLVQSDFRVDLSAEMDPDALKRLHQYIANPTIYGRPLTFNDHVFGPPELGCTWPDRDEPMPRIPDETEL